MTKKSLLPTRILILTNRLDGGTGTFVMHFSYIQEMFPHTYDVRVLALERPRFRLKKSFIVPTVFYPDKHPLPFGYRATPGVIKTLAKEFIWSVRQMRRFQPDIVMTLDTHCGLIGCLLKLSRFKTKLVLTIHNNVSEVSKYKLSPGKRKIMAAVCRRLFPLADAIIGVSRGVSVDVQDLFKLKKPVLTIYNGVDRSSVEPTLTTGITDIGDITLMASGRLTLQKDFATILRAVRILVPKFPGLTLHIFGDGENLRALIQLARRLRISRRVIFHGWTSNITQRLARTDIYILSSVYEGFSYALLEAMNAGVPVVATNTPYGPAEILDNGTYGLLVPPSDPSALAQAITSLIRDPSLYVHFRLAGIKRSQYFTRKRMVKSYHQLFMSFLGKSNSQRFPQSVRAEPI